MDVERLIAGVTFRAILDWWGQLVTSRKPQNRKGKTGISIFIGRRRSEWEKLRKLGRIQTDPI
jgi:hypothetical protein